MRGKWWIALLALIAFPIAMAALTLVMDKRYTASMRLLATQKMKPYDTNSGPFAAIDDVTNSSVLGSVETTVQILTGTEVLGQAIVRTAEKFPDSFKGGAISDKYESLVRRLAVDSSPQSDVITVRVTMDNPDIAAETANNVGYAFIDYLRQMESETGNAATALIKKNLDETSSKLKNVDDEIKKVKDQYGIPDQASTGTVTTSAIAQTEAKLSEQVGQLESARAILTVSEGLLAATPSSIKVSTQNQANPTLLELESQKARLETALSGLRVKYMDDADPVKELQGQLQAVNKSIASVKKTIEGQSTTALNPNYQQVQMQVLNARSSVAGYEQQVAESRQLLDTLKARSNLLPEVERKMNDLLRQRLILENSFAQLEQRKAVIESSGSGRKSPSRIVSTALAPGAPSFPDVRLFALIGLALGFIVAALIIMPKGDTDLYGQWPQDRSKPLKAKTAPSVATQTEAPALGDSGPDDQTQA